MNFSAKVTEDNLYMRQGADSNHPRIQAYLVTVIS
jgi:hypothetical protein